ncbi:hypothetical protein [Azohydromonas lata]|uniref:TubC N-terminal docking domain-containing protein n=1 Tax=Azohydromonas lata TaxID=45677 RepID=A0ABU5IFI1_9BURK|nr:hypothetical protein [Azohydromonas lata]MDZ5457891.1 hypothetical protein [Azohydromonas lata]
MHATELLRGLHRAGFVLALGHEDKLLVTPASRLTEMDRAEIRAHRDDLVRLLTKPNSALAATADAENCVTCMHRTRADVCGRPVEAGLASHFEVFFCDTLPGAGVGCPAWSARPPAWT